MIMIRNNTKEVLTCLFRVNHAGVEDVDEPLEWVLVHGVDRGQVSQTEEQDLAAISDGNVQGSCLVNINLSHLGRLHFQLFKHHSIADS